VTANGVLIAGAGIGGLTAARALGCCGIGVTLIEQAEKLEEAGAGIQLSPNAARVLAALGLAERLKPAIVEPSAIRVRSGPAGRDIATMRLDSATLDRYGAPYWVIHRADLQKALIEAIADQPQITLKLGATVDNFTIGPAGVRASVHRGSTPRPEADCSGAALIGADGLWSRLRARLGDGATPRFAGRSAFRAIVPATQLPPQDREPIVNLWIGPDGHLVHYPVRAGAAVNIVAVCGDQWESSTWNTSAGRDEVLERFPATAWAAARQLLEAPERWQKWALYDRAPSASWGYGPVTLLGDAAHPMLPFLAQGAAMAIEDAAVLARELAGSPTDYAGALRRYESERRTRTARVQREARRNDFRYHLRQPAAFLRDALLQAFGGERLLAQYDWIYQWRP
jgi:2-polyprenyl-6-methoxyphenol hydroxylase-like FAD-dependent oxidoreductase